MDPTRDFAFVIMDATEQIRGIQISSEGCPRVLGLERSSASSNLPLEILDKNGEDCSTQYKVVECYFEVDGEKVVPVEAQRVREELARSSRQKGVPSCSMSEKETNPLIDRPEKLIIEEQRGQRPKQSKTICSESTAISTLDAVKPDCFSEQSGDSLQVTFNLGSSSYKDCSPVEKTRRMEVRMEDFRLLNARKDGNCSDKNTGGEEKLEILPPQKLLLDQENEKFTSIIRSRAKNCDDSARLQKDDGTFRKTNAKMRRASTGKLLVDAMNYKLGQQRNSFSGFNSETKLQVSAEASAKESRSLESDNSVEIKEQVESRHLESGVSPSIVPKRPVGRPRKVVAKTAEEENSKKSRNLESVKSEEGQGLVDCRNLENAVGPSIVQKRPRGRPRKVVAKATEGEAVSKDSRNNLQLKEENKEGTRELLNQATEGLKFKEAVSKTDKVVKGLVRERQTKKAEEKNLAAALLFVEDLRKLDIPNVKYKHQENLVYAETFGENVHRKTAAANEMLGKSGKSQNNLLLQKLHRGYRKLAPVDWDEESESSYDVVLLRELSTDDPDSKQASDVDDPNEAAILNAKQATQKRIQELLAEIMHLTSCNFEYLASCDAFLGESFADVTTITEQERLRLDSIVKGEQDKVTALQIELNARAHTLTSAEAEVLSRKAQLTDIQQAFKIREEKIASEWDRLSKARSKVIEEYRNIATMHKKLRSSKCRGTVATPIKPLIAGKHLVKRATVGFYRKRRPAAAKLQSKAKARAQGSCTFVHFSTTPETDAQVMTEAHVASNTTPSPSESSAQASVYAAVTSLVALPLIEKSFTEASAAESSPVASSGTNEDSFATSFPLKAVFVTASSTEAPSLKPVIPTSLSFFSVAKTYSNPSACANIPSNSLSSSSGDISTFSASTVEAVPPLLSAPLNNEICLPTAASEVEMFLPSSSSVDMEIVPPFLPLQIELVPPPSASVAESLLPVSSPSLVEILPRDFSSSTVEFQPPVSLSSEIEIPPACSSSVAETLPPASSSSVAEILHSTSSPSKSETFPLTSTSNIQSRSPSSSSIKASATSPSTPSTSKSAVCRSPSVSCSGISPACRHLFSSSICMLPSVTLVPVTTPYFMTSRINHPCATNLEKSSPPRVLRKRGAISRNISKPKKFSKN